MPAIHARESLTTLLRGRRVYLARIRSAAGGIRARTDTHIYVHACIGAPVIRDSKIMREHSGVSSLCYIPYLSLACSRWNRLSQRLGAISPGPRVAVCVCVGPRAKLSHAIVCANSRYRYRYRGTLYRVTNSRERERLNILLAGDGTPVSTTLLSREEEAVVAIRCKRRHLIGFRRRRRRDCCCCCCSGFKLISLFRGSGVWCNSRGRGKLAEFFGDCGIGDRYIA